MVHSQLLPNSKLIVASNHASCAVGALLIKTTNRGNLPRVWRAQENGSNMYHKDVLHAFFVLHPHVFPNEQMNEDVHLIRINCKELLDA